MAKALSLNEIRRRAAQFVVEWRDEPGDERQQAQSFIRDLLRVFGITSTKAALYEKRAKRSSTGHRGYIDALVPGLCAIEMKSAGKDLEVAERQALDYIDDLTDVETPRWVISSDFTQFRILDLKAPDGANMFHIAGKAPYRHNTESQSRRAGTERFTNKLKHVKRNKTGCLFSWQNSSYSQHHRSSH